MAEMTGGEELARYLAEIRKKFAKKTSVDIGFLKDGPSYPSNVGGAKVAFVAATQEFGAPASNIPARPYFRTMIQKNKGNWVRDIAALLARNKLNVRTTLNQFGMEVEGELRESIIATDSPALSPVTLMLRKMRSEDPSLVMSGTVVGIAAARVAAGESYAGVNTKVLDDTGLMLRSVDHKVE